MSRHVHAGWTLALAAAASLLALPAAQAARFSLAAPWYLETTQAGARNVVVADFNGDGRDDVAYQAWLYMEQSVHVAWQRADGSLSVPELVAQPVVVTHHLHAADVDGDGVAELLVGHDGGLTVHALREGQRSVRHVAAQAACRFIASGDVDLDGALDVYCQGLHGAATLFMGRDGAGLVTSRAMEVPGIGNHVVIADVSGDALPDLVLAGLGHNALYVLRGDGAGGFEPAIAYVMPGENIQGTPTVAVADLDGDGADEVVVVEKDNTPRAALYVMRRGTDGHLRFAETLPSLDLPTAVIAEDMDGDGHVELVVTHSGWHSVSHYIGTPAGPRPVPYFTDVRTEHAVSALAVGDVDADGQRDVVLANLIGPAVLYGGRDQPIDVDGDLVSDLAWRHDAGRGTVWLAADPALAMALPTLSSAWVPIPAGKFHHYGGTGFLYRNQANGANRYWASGYDEPQPYSGAASSWMLVGAGDFAGDGASDLLWRNRVSGQNVLWQDGSLSNPGKLQLVADQDWTIVGIGDFDGDGRSDLLWRHAVTGANVVWPGADRRRQLRLPGASVDWIVAGVGDFDRDGRDDVAWRNTHSGRNTIWRAANAALVMPIRGVTDTRWQVAAVGDYNGDGYSDLAWRHAEDGRNVIWLSADATRQVPLQRVRDTGWRVVR